MTDDLELTAVKLGDLMTMDDPQILKGIELLISEILARKDAAEKATHDET